MRSELSILRDIESASRHLLARYPFDSPDEMHFWLWSILALLHAEITAKRDWDRKR